MPSAKMVSGFIVIDGKAMIGAVLVESTTRDASL